jgi:hypothetical protein
MVKIFRADSAFKYTFKLFQSGDMSENIVLSSHDVSPLTGFLFLTKLTIHI